MIDCDERPGRLLTALYVEIDESRGPGSPGPWSTPPTQRRRAGVSGRGTSAAGIPRRASVDPVRHTPAFAEAARHVRPDPDSKDALVGHHPLPVATTIQHAVVASRPTEVCPPGLIDRQLTADAPGRRLVGRHLNPPGFGRDCIPA